MLFFPAVATIASDFVTVGYVRYLCLKNIVSELHSVLVFHIQSVALVMVG
jgi:hypothetical protein